MGWWEEGFPVEKNGKEAEMVWEESERKTDLRLEVVDVCLYHDVMVRKTCQKHRLTTWHFTSLSTFRFILFLHEFCSKEKKDVWFKWMSFCWMFFCRCVKYSQHRFLWWGGWMRRLSHPKIPSGLSSWWWRQILLMSRYVVFYDRWSNSEN